MPRLPTCAMLAVTFAVAACGRAPNPPDNADAMSTNAAAAFMKDEMQWRQQRLERLLKPDGWASLIGLHWIEPGSHYIGSAADNGIRLQMGPAHLGMIDLSDGKLHFVPDKDATLTLDGQPLADATDLRSDLAEGGASVIGFDGGKGEALVIERGDRYALRVKHADAPTRTGFTQIDYWPASPSWKVTADYVPNPPGQTIEVTSIIGTVEPVANPGKLVFEHDGKQYAIEAQDEGEDELFLVFADRTNGHGSYGAGRFLYVPRPGADNKVVIDFNHSYNPPCAFTPFATCPLPPPENRLDLAITAGEKAYVSPSHQ